MSNLPPALAARLAKRGLINKNNNRTESNENAFTELKSSHDQEEVIAENYDDTPNKQEIIKFKNIDTVPGCPNKYNIFHNCTSYCAKKYSDVSEKPSKLLRRKFAQLLKQYPLKDSIWQQVYEPGLKTYYFWNTETDQVSWLPPSHPDAKISMPAEKLRKLLRDDERTSDKEESDDEQKDESNTNDSFDSSSDDSNDSDDNEDSLKLKFKRMRTLIESHNQMDPMDPASYSNIPKGKWSDGLRKN